MPVDSVNLLLVCVTAFSAVFVLLGALALVMRGLIAVFPAPLPSASTTDPAVVAAISAAAAAAYPDSTITKIEETR